MKNMIERDRPKSPQIDKLQWTSKNINIIENQAGRIDTKNRGNKPKKE